jgi:CRISPR/Cas system-associated exonuclease Cas4 (RecB family)
MRNLSKSKLIAYKQCPKRVWLEVHHPELREDSDSAQAGFSVGHVVGEIAQHLYDAKGEGVLLDAQRDGFDTVFKRSIDLLSSSQPIFEAGYTANGALAFADVMLPVTNGGKQCWRMVEVKSSTGVKDYHRDDTAIQSYIARSAGVPLVGVALAHIDSSWVYPGNEDYLGLLKEVDLTTEALGRDNEVREWIADAHEIVAQKTEPKMDTGKQCSTPFECGFYTYCNSKEPQAEYPVTWLPSIQAKALKAQ